MSAAKQARAAKRATVIKAMAHPSRLLCLEALMAGELCVADLTSLVGADISTVSKHLALLRSVGLVTIEKRGLQVFYRIACPCLGTFFECMDDLTSSARSSKRRAAARCQC